MNDPRFAPSQVYPAAARRAGLLAVLVVSFAWYARGPRSVDAAAATVAIALPGAPTGRHVMVYTAGPDAPDERSLPAVAADAGLAERVARLVDAALGRKPDAPKDGAEVPPSSPADFAAALSGRADPASLPPDAAQAARDAKVVGDLLGALGIPPSGAAMPLPKEGQEPSLPIDEATKTALQAEAAAGVAGPATRKFIADAEKLGYLDLPLYGGRSMRQIMGKAQALSDQANARAEALRKEQNEGMGIKPGDDEPAVVVPRLLRDLRSNDDEAKAYAAAELANVRFASYPGATDAIPILEEMTRQKKPDFEFAELALRRLRHVKAKRDFDEKSR